MNKSHPKRRKKSRNRAFPAWHGRDSEIGRRLQSFTTPTDMNIHRSFTISLLLAGMLHASEPFPFEPLPPEINTVSLLDEILTSKYPDNMERERIISQYLLKKRTSLKGKDAPEIEFSIKNNNIKRLSDLRGNPVIVIFIFSPAFESCESNKKFKENMIQNKQQIIDSGIPIILVHDSPNIKEVKEHFLKLIGEIPYTGIAFHAGEYGFAWGTNGVPAPFLVDGWGKVSTVSLYHTDGITGWIQKAKSLPAAPPALPLDRNITDAKGRSMLVTILEKNATHIKTKRLSDGKEFEIAIQTLSPEDQKFIKECQDAIPLKLTSEKPQQPDELSKLLQLRRDRLRRDK